MSAIGSLIGRGTKRCCFLSSWVAGAASRCWRGVSNRMGRRGGMIPNPSQTPGCTGQGFSTKSQDLTDPSSTGSSCDIGRAPRAQGTGIYGDRDTKKLAWLGSARKENSTQDFKLTLTPKMSRSRSSSRPRSQAHAHTHAQDITLTPKISRSRSRPRSHTHSHAQDVTLTLTPKIAQDLTLTLTITPKISRSRSRSRPRSHAHSRAQDLTLTPKISRSLSRPRSHAHSRAQDLTLRSSRFLEPGGAFPEADGGGVRGAGTDGVTAYGGGVYSAI